MKAKKLYWARVLHEVVFVSEESPNSSNLKSEAESFLEEQDASFIPPMVVTEITSKEEIPDDWKGDALIWGTQELETDEMTANQFFDEYGDAEYQEYLRLKSKFEKKKR